MLGHTAYFVNDTYLFTGDTALLSPSGKILPCIKLINMDTATQIASNRKLIQLIASKPIKLIGSAHSGFKMYKK